MAVDLDLLRAQVQNQLAKIDMLATDMELGFEKAVQDAQRQTYQRLAHYLEGQTSWEALAADERVQWYLARRRVLAELLEQTSFYKDYIDALPGFNGMVDKLLAAQGIDFAAMDPAHLKALLAQPQQRFAFLTGQANSQLLQQLYTEVVQGVTKADALLQLKGSITGTYPWGQRQGLYEWHAGTYARTGHLQYVRSYEAELAKDAGITRFLYSGPLDKRTRPWCRARVGKVYTAEAVGGMTNPTNRNGRNPEVEGAQLSGGGYNCRHHWVPLADKVAKKIEEEQPKAAGPDSPPDVPDAPLGAVAPKGGMPDWAEKRLDMTPHSGLDKAKKLADVEQWLKNTGVVDAPFLGSYPVDAAKHMAEQLSGLHRTFGYKLDAFGNPQKVTDYLWAKGSKWSGGKGFAGTCASDDDRTHGISMAVKSTKDYWANRLKTYNYEELAYVDALDSVTIHEYGHFLSGWKGKAQNWFDIYNYPEELVTEAKAVLQSKFWPKELLAQATKKGDQEFLKLAARHSMREYSNYSKVRFLAEYPSTALEQYLLHAPEHVSRYSRFITELTLKRHKVWAEPGQLAATSPRYSPEKVFQGTKKMLANPATDSAEYAWGIRAEILERVEQGVLKFTADQLDELAKAMADFFAKVPDPKATAAALSARRQAEWAVKQAAEVLKTADKRFVSLLDEALAKREAERAASAFPAPGTVRTGVRPPEWLVRDANQRWTAMTQEARDFVQDYTLGGYKRINDLLRDFAEQAETLAANESGKRWMLWEQLVKEYAAAPRYGAAMDPAKLADQIISLEARTQYNQLQETVRVYRGVTGRFSGPKVGLDEDTLLREWSDQLAQRYVPGQEVTLVGFQSTSLGVEAALDASKSFQHGYVFEIRTTRGLYIGDKSKFDDELELLIGSGHRFRVVSVRPEVYETLEGATAKRVTVQLELIP